MIFSAKKVGPVQLIETPASKYYIHKTLLPSYLWSCWGSGNEISIQAVFGSLITLLVFQDFSKDTCTHYVKFSSKVMEANSAKGEWVNYDLVTGNYALSHWPIMIKSHDDTPAMTAAFLTTFLWGSLDWIVDWIDGLDCWTENWIACSNRTTDSWMKIVPDTLLEMFERRGNRLLTTGVSTSLYMYAFRSPTYFCMKWPWPSPHLDNCSHFKNNGKTSPVTFSDVFVFWCCAGHT